jgi:hypothetical protein
LYIERREDQPDDFNIHHLRGWQCGEMIIALAAKNRGHLYKAWRDLMQTRFHGQGAEDRRVVNLSKDREVIVLTKNYQVFDLTGDY